MQEVNEKEVNEKEVNVKKHKTHVFGRFPTAKNSGEASETSREDAGNKKSRRNSLLWLGGFVLIVGIIFVWLGSMVVKVDPFFHYKAPDTETYYYELDNARSQNDGIVRQFDYDALILGTSMAQNFKTSECDEIFGVNSAKSVFTGASFMEVGDNLKRALEANSNIKMVIRSLDMDFFFLDYNETGGMATGEYPTYLYDDNIFNDYQYVLNRDVIFGRVYPMIKATQAADFEPGITSFDDYGNWMNGTYTFGANTVLADEDLKNYEMDTSSMSEHEKHVVKRNITRNITDIADQYPDVTFYYYIPPYSAVWWNRQMEAQVLQRELECEQYVLELMLEHDNIRVFSYNTNTAITTNLNHYKDLGHYGEWVNSAILEWMHDGIGEVTKDNLAEYIAEEREIYSNLDYTALKDQEDYDDDRLVSHVLLGVHYTEEMLNEGELMKAEIVQDEESGYVGVRCVGTIDRDPVNGLSVEEHLFTEDYCGIKLTVEDLGLYSTISFKGYKTADHGMPTVVVYSEDGETEAVFNYSYAAIDEEIQVFSMDVSGVSGKAVIIFNGGYTDNIGNPDSEFTFLDICLS